MSDYHEEQQPLTSNPGDLSALFAASRSMEVNTLDASDVIGDGLVVAHHTGDSKIETLDLERYLPQPRRPHGFLTVRTADAFADYVKAHEQPGRTIILADKDKVAAIFNDHLGQSFVPHEDERRAGWRDWGCKLVLEYTESWQAWVNLAGSGYQASESFADFLQENALDVIEPDAARLLEIVSNLRLASNTRVTRRVNLQNGGVRFEFEEDFQPVGESDADHGTIEVPAGIRINLQAFYDGPSFDVPLLLRYRVKEGRIEWLVKFTSEKRKIFENAFDNLTESIATATGIRVYRGSL